MSQDHPAQTKRKHINELEGKEVYIHILGKDSDSNDNYYKGVVLSVSAILVILKDYNGEGKHLFVPMTSVESIMMV